MTDTLPNSETKELGELETKLISFETLIIGIVLIIYTIANPILRKFNITFVHESGICMILGCLINLFAQLINPNVTYSINFNISIT